jgi:hypothetical protein
MSIYGWTYLSRTALRRAEHQLSGEGEGVRDEIGFLILHQRYADHFLPGTSVLHTRLRYALFVPWIYQTLHEERARGHFKDRLKDAERRLTYQVRHQRGAIGRETYPEPAAQPAGERYWAALGAWGLLRGAWRLLACAGACPDRDASREARDDDGQPMRLELLSSACRLGQRLG